MAVSESIIYKTESTANGDKNEELLLTTFEDKAVVTQLTKFYLSFKFTGLVIVLTISNDLSNAL